MLEKEADRRDSPRLILNEKMTTQRVAGLALHHSHSSRWYLLRF